MPNNTALELENLINSIRGDIERSLSGSEKLNLVNKIDKLRGDIRNVPAIMTDTIDWSKVKDLDTQAKIRALGIAMIDDVGNENVYVLKDGIPYYFKPINTDNYAVGEHNFTNDNAYGEDSIDPEITDPEPDITPELTTTETDTNEQTSEQTEITPEVETAGTEVGIEIPENPINSDESLIDQGQISDIQSITNINASSVSDAIKQKAIKYLQENPASHEIPVIAKKSMNAIMYSIKSALFAEIKALSPLLEWDGTANYISYMLGDHSELTFQVVADNKSPTGYKLSFNVMDEQTGLNNKIFDSTSTIEELKQWGFALPFDLDVKAFVANVIKPVVDEFLSKQVDNPVIEEANLPEIIPEEATKTPATLSQAKSAMVYLKKFIGVRQLNAISTEMRGEEKQFFFDKVVDLESFIKKMPKTYDQDSLGDKAKAYLHYFKGNMDWHITERDMEDDQFQAFGMANLGHGGELGYISIDELIKNNIEIDLYWTPKTIRVIKGGKDDDGDINPVIEDPELITPAPEPEIVAPEPDPEPVPAISGNPETDKQKTKLAGLQRLQEQMKSANKVLKNSKLTDDQKKEALTALGYGEGEVYKLMKPDFAGRMGFSYHLTNNNAVMKSTMKRIAQLEAQDLAAAKASNGDSETSYDFDGGTIELDYSADRLKVDFDVKPDSDMLSKMKQNGFKWSPTNSVWQRQLTDNAISTANYLFGTKIKTAASMMTDEENKPRPNPIIPAVESVNPIVEAQGDQLKSAFEIELNGLMLEPDALIYLDKLEQIAVRVEAAGLSEVLDAKLNEVADILTELLAKAEAG